MHERCQVLRDGRLSNVGDPYLMKVFILYIIHWHLMQVIILILKC